MNESRSKHTLKNYSLNGVGKHLVSENDQWKKSTKKRNSPNLEKSNDHHKPQDFCAEFLNCVAGVFHGDYKHRVTLSEIANNNVQFMQ